MGQASSTSLKLSNWDPFPWANTAGTIRAALWEEHDGPHSSGGDAFTHESPKEHGSCFRMLAACPRSWRGGSSLQGPTFSVECHQESGAQYPIPLTLEPSDNSVIFPFSPQTAQTSAEKHCSYCPKAGQFLLEKTFPKQCPPDGLINMTGKQCMKWFNDNL